MPVNPSHFINTIGYHLKYSRCIKMADWNSGPTVVDSWNQDGDVKPSFGAGDYSNDATGWNDNTFSNQVAEKANGSDTENQ